MVDVNIYSHSLRVIEIKWYDDNCIRSLTAIDLLYTTHYNSSLSVIFENWVKEKWDREEAHRQLKDIAWATRIILPPPFPLFNKSPYSTKNSYHFLEMLY